MEFRELECFLAIIEHGTISGAAQALHVAQPSLSRQMREMEERLGRTLFLRGNRRITLTEEGMILQKRAEELIQLRKRTESEIESMGADISGDIYIGAAETKAVHYITQTATALRTRYPDVHFHITSGDTNDTLYQLEQGLIDFALLFWGGNDDRYECLTLPKSDHWGALMLKSDPLARKKRLNFPEDFIDRPLIMSRLTRGRSAAGSELSKLNVVATYNLAYNASLMVEDGMGIAICFDSIVNVNNSEKDNLCFVPVSEPPVSILPAVIWKSSQPQTRAAREYINLLSDILESRRKIV